MPIFEILEMLLSFKYKVLNVKPKEYMAKNDGVCVILFFGHAHDYKVPSTNQFVTLKIFLIKHLIKVLIQVFLVQEYGITNTWGARI